MSRRPDRSRASGMRRLVAEPFRSPARAEEFLDRTVPVGPSRSSCRLGLAAVGKFAAAIATRSNISGGLAPGLRGPSLIRPRGGRLRKVGPATRGEYPRYSAFLWRGRPMTNAGLMPFTLMRDRRLEERVASFRDDRLGALPQCASTPRRSSRRNRETACRT